MSQVFHDCAQRASLEPAAYKPKLHCALVAFTRHRRAYRGLAKSKVAGSAQSIGSQDAVPTSERDFQLWWRNADVEAALSPADFEGTPSMACDSSNAQPQLTSAECAGLRGMSADKAINSGDAIVSLPRTAALLVTPKMRNPFPDKIDTAYWSKCQWSVDILSCFLHEHYLFLPLFLLPRMRTRAFLSGDNQ